MTVYTGTLARQLIVATALRTRVAAGLVPHDLNMTEWLILHYLAEAGDQRPTDLAAYLEISVSLVSVTTRPLIRRGLVVGIAKTRDRREKHLSLTDDGRGLLTAVEATLTAKYSAATRRQGMGATS